MAVTVTIAGSSKRVLIPSLRINMTLGASWTAEFDVADPDSTVSAYRPALDATVVIASGATTLFSGTIKGVRDNPIIDTSTGTVTHVTAHSYADVVDQVIAAVEYASGQTLKQDVTAFRTTFLNAYGITLDAAMANGPTLENQIFDYVSARSVLNHFSEISGWPWRITPGKVLEMFSVGTKTAAYSLTAANRLSFGPVSWEKNRAQYVNTIYVRYGGAVQVPKAETFLGNGVATSFALRYPPIENGNYVVSQGYVSEPGVNYPLESTIGGVKWSYNHASFTMERTPALGVGIAATFIHTVQFPIISATSDAGEVAAHGVWADVFEAPDIFDIDAAAELATGLLRKFLNAPKVVSISTRQGFEMPGTVITLTFTARTISGSYMIRDVVITFDTDQVPQYELTCIEGTENLQSWTQLVKDALNGDVGRSSSGTITGSIVPNFSGHFNDDVSAHTGGIVSADYESRLSTYQNSGGSGPSLRLGRQDKGYAWEIFADVNLGATPGSYGRLRFHPSRQGSAIECAMELTEPVSGGTDFYLLPGASARLFLGDYNGSSGVSSPQNTIDGIKAGGLKLLGPMELGTRISPTSLSAATHNWNPTGLSTTSRIYIAASAAVDLTGIVGQNDGRAILLVNASGFDITLKNDSASSTLGNRFVGANFADVVLRANNGSVWVHYSTSSGFGYWYVHGPMDDSVTALGTSVPHTWTAMQTFAGGVTIGSMELKVVQSLDGSGNTVLSLIVPYAGIDYAVASITI